MSKQIIKAGDVFTSSFTDKPKIKISEFFCDTLQGEGISAGLPSMFLRLSDCTLNCKWCDTTEVWRKGNYYSVGELMDLFINNKLLEKIIFDNHKLVITGGSPLLQQDIMKIFIYKLFINLNELAEFKELSYYNKNFIEIENECMIKPNDYFSIIPIQWNNSPKLSNSNMKKSIRYKPEIIKYMSELPNSTFKFVISNIEDWKEVEEDFLTPNLIKKEQIILMPCGQTQEELKHTRELTADIAINNSVKFSDRLHITLWDKKTGV